MRAKRKAKPIAVDLFSGAGGLSLGLQKAGFKIAAGVELSNAAVKTYRANLRRVRLLAKDIRHVSARSLLRATKNSRIDLLASCPPCQGFSKLTDKHVRSDPRNKLVLEVARLVRTLKPRMVMMENVPGLADRGKRIFNKLLAELKTLGYQVDWGVLQLADYGIPQSRRRLVLLAGLGFKVSIPKPTHSRDPKSNSGLLAWKTLREAIEGMPKPVTLKRALKDGGPQLYYWHVVRNLSQMNRRRLSALRAGSNRYKLPRSLRPKCHKANKAGFRNVYGRLNWGQLPPTMTSGCTRPSMGRFGHPDRVRTISVREAALIQTFPPDFKIVTDRMDTACALVGNALPVDFAAIAGRACMEALEGRTRR